MFSLLLSPSSSLIPVLILLTTCCEFKCFGHKFDLHCQQISDHNILLNWKKPQFYSKPSIFMTEKISHNQTRYHALKHTESSLIINTTDTCKLYEFEYISVETFTVLNFANCKCHYRNNSKIQIKVTGKKDNEVILFAHDPNRDISTGNQIGSFGIPTRITFRAPKLFLAPKIYARIKIRKLTRNVVLLTWKVRKIALKKPYFMVILRDSPASSLKMSVLHNHRNNFKAMKIPFKRKYRVIIYQYLDGMPDWPTVITIRNRCKLHSLYSKSNICLDCSSNLH
uniref:Fibronectin type-III domain-containing protein n=1 Tax=Trichobilharzia regenti TaxID=157069 RepID=A0AA85JSS5_TRIRE|nr:unnamed protein product [Trichobilharzia regenti]